MKTTNDSVSIPQHVCTIEDPRLANDMLFALVGFSVAGAAWLLSAMFAGPWLADTLLVEGIVSALVVLSRALGCGRCQTPQCRCT